MIKRTYKISLKRYIQIILVVLAVWLICGSLAVRAESTPKGQIVFSVEKSTIGQGFIIEPQYVDFYDGDTLASITLRQLTKAGRRYNYDGRLQHGFYLSEISDPGRGTVKIPDYIQDIIKKNKLKLYQKDYTPEYLGEKDYCPQSGWVYDYNGVQPNTSACDIVPRNGAVLQWKFTVVTLGKDVNGDMEYLNSNGKAVPDRVKLNKLLAEVRRKPELMKNSSVKSAYDRCLKLTVNMRTSRSDLTTDMNTLRKALNWNTVSEIQLWGNQPGECTVKNGTPEKNIPFPRVLKANKSDGQTVNMNVTWYCEDGFQASKAGDYIFTPVIPDSYIVSEDAKLPTFTVHVRKFGDVNKDGLVNEQDIEKMMDSTGNYFGKEFESDEEGAVCDLNEDGIVNMQDYSLLNGAINGTDVRSEDDGKLVLKFASADCKAGEETTAELILYSGMLDTVGMQLNTTEIAPGIKLKCHAGFQVEFHKTNDKGIFVMLGRRSGAMSAQNLQGISIGTFTFTCKKDGNPALSFGEATETVSEGQSILGYRNGYKVTFDTGANYGTDTRFLFQLNQGRVRTGQIQDDEITENGLTMKTVKVIFRASDAENTSKNRIRIRVQLPSGCTFEAGGGLKNGELTDLFTLKDEIYSGENEVGCFTLGQSPQRESCEFYGILTDQAGNRTYYKFFAERKGYKTTKWKYTGACPLILNGWDSRNPEVLTGIWNLDDADIQGWDTDGNLQTDLYVAMPSGDTSQKLYYTGKDDRSGTLCATEAGDYWLEIKDGAGEVRGKIRVTAVYPYDAASWFIKKAQEISLKSEDYKSSVASQLFDYKDMIDKVQKIQDKYPENLPIYLDGMGRYTTKETSIRMKDDEGYEIFADSLRTETVNELRKGIREIRPLLEKNKKKTVKFTGPSTINKDFAKKTFSLGIKTNSNGKITYESSNKKVATVSSSGKVTMKAVGQAVITVCAKETSTYKAGTTKITVNLNPQKSSLKTTKSVKKSTLSVSWKKIKGITGYQIQYSTSKNFKGAKTVNISSKASSGIIKRLKSKKQYYVRIRTYKKVYGKTVYSSWSKAKRAKIK